MRRSNQADREAFEAEMLPHLDAAYRLARALARRTEDAEDLVQEAYLRAFAGFDGYQRGTNARAWLLTIVRRVHINQWRRARARPQLLPLAGPEEPEEPVDTVTPSAEDEALQHIEQRHVLDALAELPESFRSVLALVDLDGMHYAEAAEVLGCPIGTVMSRLHRGRLRLARRLQISGYRGQEL
jgi:RNA polymerase sigma-70 factor (ECF subfamily)